MVTYLRLVNRQDWVHVAFVMGKSRVATLNLMLTPHLELTAAVLPIRLGLSIFWTDSTTVIKYIGNDIR